MFAMQNMFKVTVFMKKSYEELCQELKGLGFQKSKEDVLHYRLMDNYVFRIEKMRHQQTYDSICGYKIYFNTTIDVASYIFDTALSSYNPFIQAVECQLYEKGKKQRELCKRVMKHQGIMKKGDFGLYQIGEVQVVVMDEIIHLQRRRWKGQSSLQLLKELSEIRKVRQLFEPINHRDLFSFIDEMREGVS